MELKGKKIVLLGDSITEWHGTSAPEHIYWQILARRTGAVCSANAIGGSRITPQYVPSEKPENDLYFASRLEEMEQNADIVVVFGGTNDFGHGDAPFGTFEDRTEETFCGAFHVLLMRLIEKYPTAQLVVMTPLHRSVESNCGMNSWGFRRVADLETYVDTIVRIAGFYGIPVLDLFRTSGIQPKVPILKELYMPDGLHPNDAGHIRIAEKLIGFLQTL